jgi:T-complex protein 1 subunit epsilon
LGVDSLDMGISCMQKQKVFESMNSKKQQIQLATQVTKMILKIDDIIKPDEAVEM